jgi:aldose 1-epimerase
MHKNLYFGAMHLNLRTIVTAVATLCFIYLSACKKAGNAPEVIVKDTVNTSVLLPSPAGFTPMIEGKQVRLFFLKNKYSATAAVTNYGARLVGLLMPDKTGKLTNVVMGFDSIPGYVQAGGYYGATLGRYAHRIGGSKFTLDGVEYKLFQNNPGNTVHGGKKGFDSMVWDARQIDKKTLELTYVSKDMEENFPGNLSVKITYTLTDDNALVLSYEATTDKKTIVNLSNHTYFNLNGLDGSTVVNHLLYINADNYLPVGRNKLPLGDLEPVLNTPFNFTATNLIGLHIDDVNPQINIAKGYDNYFVFNPHSINTVVASAQGDKSGIKMELFTTEPGMEFYTVNNAPGTHVFFGGQKDIPRASFAMEAMHYPNSPNEPAFPSTQLKPGDLYKTQTIYKFLVSK